MEDGTFVAVVAIVVPFLFTAWVIATGRNAKENRQRKRDARQPQQPVQDDAQDLVQGIRDLQKRIDNLEIILRDKHKE